METKRVSLLHRWTSGQTDRIAVPLEIPTTSKLILILRTGFSLLYRFQTAGNAICISNEWKSIGIKYIARLWVNYLCDEWHWGSHCSRIESFKIRRKALIFWWSIDQTVRQSCHSSVRSTRFLHLWRSVCLRTQPIVLKSKPNVFEGKSIKINVILQSLVNRVVVYSLINSTDILKSNSFWILNTRFKDLQNPLNPAITERPITLIIVMSCKLYSIKNYD